MKRLGKYDLLEELGRGGMGVVHRAHDSALARDVAIKLVTTERLGSEKELERFRNEARAMARLRHPNIVAIHQVGETPDGPFLVMDYVPGETLKARLDREGALEQRLAARIASKIARALALAHGEGILHRDVKPANILLGPGDEPLLADFGLARDVDTKERLTEKSVVVGTPSYMAPEQARGRSEKLDRRVDVYALGATLYEALTAQPPFDGETGYEILQAVVRVEAVPPVGLRAGIDRDLSTIVMKCLEKDRADRYASAEALADDLERFLRDEPIDAAPPTIVERARKWARRNRTLARAIAAFAVVAGVAGGLGTAAFVARLRAERDAARAARGRASAALDLLVSEVRDELGDVGGSRVRDVRRRLLEHALASLEKLG